MASSRDDNEEVRRYTSPFTSDHPIPTIKRFEEEKAFRRQEAERHDEHVERAENFMHSGDGEKGQNADQHGSEQQQDAGARDIDDKENVRPAIDTSEADASATDARQRRKELKKHNKDERAEREVTDPVTHLPVTIHDFTSEALKELPENDRHTSQAGLNDRKKSSKQLQHDMENQEREHASMHAVFPPPEFETSKEELKRIQRRALRVVVPVSFLLGGLLSFAAIYIDTPALWKDTAGNRLLADGASYGLLLFLGIGSFMLLAKSVDDWTSKQSHNVWEDQVWEASDQSHKKSVKAHETETVAWLNALLGSVWPLINPDLFTSLADTLEDVMQASLPRMVRMVSVNDIGQGSESVRILGIKWLPSGAAARSVTEDGRIQDKGGKRSNDREVTGEGATESLGSGNASQADDGSQQQVSEGLEAEEGDFVNMEIAFAYRAKSNKRSLKDRARDMHMYIAFYLPANLKVPVWVDLRGLVGTMRVRMQLCPDPPFVSLCTMTFLGQPKVDISCTPLSRHALNIMDVPFISNFVQSAVDAAMAQYVAPRSLNLDLKDMISGDDFKKDTNARGVLVVRIRRGYEFKVGDQGIPLLKEGSSDPYVSVGWAKFGKPVWSTRLLLKEMEPWWDETAYVLVTPQELNVDERLRVQLWDSDRLTADDDLGRIEIPVKELMHNTESNGRMWDRCDGFKSLKASEMPGKLEWSIGYFAKTKILDSQLQQQQYAPDIRSMDQLRQRVDEICQRKLREATVKEGRHKHDADELEQQRGQEFKNIQDAMMISAPPPSGYPSGIFSIQIHQITGLELEKVSKVQMEKEGDVDDEAEEGEGLPSAYCTLIINHSKTFKTRTKPKNAKPFYNASTERYIADWRNTEVFVAVRDARVKEDDPLIGIVHLPLGEVFKERSQINNVYPLAGGVGYGHIRLSMVWRSISAQLPAKAIGWEYGTVEVQGGVSALDVPKELQRLKIKFHTDLGSGKMYADKSEEGWSTKNKGSLMLPVAKRYSTCLSLQFLKNGMVKDRTAAFAVLWLSGIPDEEEQEVTLTVWKGDYERAANNAMPEPGEKIGSIKLKICFWEGLGAAHSKYASHDRNVRGVVEVLDAARTNLETGYSEERAGIVDGSVSSDSSDDEKDKNENGTDEKDEGLIDRAKNFKKHHHELNKRNRGVMQWKIPRTAQWAYHKIENTEAQLTGLFRHHTNQAKVETEV